MHGVITTKDLLHNAPTVISEFGLLTFVRCIAAVLGATPCTFLDVVARIARR